jgi:hypothetical protein
MGIGGVKRIREIGEMGVKYKQGRHIKTKTMTKKHFQSIASILKKIFREIKLTDTEKWTIYEYFEGYLREQNNNFDSARFYEAVYEERD